MFNKGYKYRVVFTVYSERGREGQGAVEITLKKKLNSWSNYTLVEQAILDEGVFSNTNTAFKDLPGGYVLVSSADRLK